jgi:glutamate dehydrogenase (NAD(P)+)
VPGALERVITKDNAAEAAVPPPGRGANGPTTNEADRLIEERGDIEVIPDILCNSGGVIVSYFEWLQNLQSYYWTRDEVLAKLWPSWTGRRTRWSTRSGSSSSAAASRR